MNDLPQVARFWMVARKPARQGDRTEPRQRYSTRADAVGIVRPDDPTEQESLL